MYVLKQIFIFFHFRPARSKAPAKRRGGRPSKVALADGDVAHARDNLMRAIAVSLTGAAPLEVLTYAVRVHVLLLWLTWTLL